MLESTVSGRRRFCFRAPQCRLAGVAQLVEQLIRNQQVVSSSLTAGSRFLKKQRHREVAGRPVGQWWTDGGRTVPSGGSREVAVVATPPCADIIASESLDSAVLVRWTGALADLMKADQAVVLAKGVQQAPVVTGFDVEQGHQQLVAAPRLFQPTTNQGPKVIASQIAGHEWIVHGRPEALAAGNQTVEQLRPGAIRTARRRAGDDGPRVPHAARKISDRDRAIIPANDDPLCHVLQLADIPRPFPPGEVAERIGREPRYRHAVLLAVLAKEVVEERRDIFGMVPQGWRAKVQYIEAVEQIKPERLDGDPLQQIPVRGGDDTDVHARSAPFASDPLNLPGFEESQQQSLHPEAHLPALIQKNCAQGPVP